MAVTGTSVDAAAVDHPAQARYAGADLAAPRRRGRAVSTVLVATTLGAVVGPNLVSVTARLAESFGVPPLAGPFMLATAAYGSAALVLWALLRPVTRRARTQGAVDLTIALAGAGGGLGSGLVVAGAGYETLALAGGVIALAVVPVVAACRPGAPVVAVATPH